MYKVCDESFCSLVAYIVIEEIKDGYLADFDYCGLFLERNPRDKRGTIVYNSLLSFQIRCDLSHPYQNLGTQGTKLFNCHHTEF